MKPSILLLLLFIAYIAIAQTAEKKFVTNQYAGEYSYGTTAEKERVGSVTIYPESDSTILFYFESNLGPPTYSMGSIYGEVQLQNGAGTFYRDMHSPSNICRFSFQFSKKRLILKQDLSQPDCGFGHGIYAQGNFKKTSTKIPVSFISLNGEEIFFAKVRPENYKD